MTEKFSLEDLKAHGKDIFILGEEMLSHIETLNNQIQELSQKNAELEAILNEQSRSSKQMLVQANASNHISKRVLLAILGSNDSLKTLL
mgnify:CR=1 FL=1